MYDGCGFAVLSISSVIVDLPHLALYFNRHELLGTVEIKMVRTAVNSTQCRSTRAGITCGNLGT